MALKDKWKNAGKSIGGAFSNFGKAVATTAKVAVGKEENKAGEDGETPLKQAWKDTGKGYKGAGKDLGTAAKGTCDKACNKDKKDVKAKNEEDIIEAEPVEEEKK